MTHVRSLVEVGMTVGLTLEDRDLLILGATAPWTPAEEQESDRDMKPRYHKDQKQGMSPWGLT